MTEFKQIIGRGTRVRDDYRKLFFNILDYTGSATKQFADPDFDGEPVRITEEEIDAEGESTGVTDYVLNRKLKIRRWKKSQSTSRYSHHCLMIRKAKFGSIM